MANKRKGRSKKTPTHADLLIELGVEEIPASYAPPALAQGAEALRALFAEAGLEHGELTTASTPRRLVWHLAGLELAGADREETVLGPPEHVAFKDGEPTGAAKGFAAKNGLALDALEVVEDPPGRKGRYLSGVAKVEGASAAALLREQLPALLRGLAFPKSMTWLEADRGLLFCRPVRALCCLLGAEVVPVELAPGLVAGREVRGHRFLAFEPFELADASWDGYVAALAERDVVVEPAERERRIRAELEQRTSRFSEALLSEVAALVELPTVIEGGFDEAFLELPDSVLTQSMAHHLKQFPVVDEAGALQPRYLAVANRRPATAELIRQGNDRVLAARLSDARYFFHADLERPIDGLLERLQTVVFHHKLGSVADKCQRLEQLAAALAPALGLEGEAAAQAQRAARICKFDLVSEMVTEFDKLQGQMGRIYAAAAGEAEAVAAAVEEHYQPRDAGDRVPAAPVSVAVAIADRLDNLVGLFAAAGPPKGGDRFGLRRAALGLIRLLRENRLHLSIRAAVEAAAAGYPTDLEKAKPAEQVEPVLAFIGERLRNHLLEGGTSYDLVDAALSPGWDDLADLDARLAALEALRQTDRWDPLVAAVERTYNIHKNAEQVAETVDPERFSEPLERELWQAHQVAEQSLRAQAEAGDWQPFGEAFHDAYAEVLSRFFDEVFVNDDDLAVRANRLALLREVGELFRARLADLSTLTDAR